MKLYNLEFVQVNYAQDIANGVNLSARAAYEQRKPLFNTTDYSFFNSAQRRFFDVGNRFDICT